jgi:hypothetical protein
LQRSKDLERTRRIGCWDENVVVVIRRDEIGADPMLGESSGDCGCRLSVGQASAPTNAETNTTAMVPRTELIQ